MSHFKGVFRKKPSSTSADGEEVRIVETKNPDGSITTTTTRIVKSATGPKTVSIKGNDIIGESTARIGQSNIASSGKVYKSTVTTTITKGGDNKDAGSPQRSAASDPKPTGWFNNPSTGGGPKKEASPEKKGIAGFTSRYIPGNLDPVKAAEIVDGGKKLFGAVTGKNKFKDIKKAKEGEKIDEGVQCYQTIKSKLAASGKLFEDEEFPATDASVFYSEAGRVDVVWKRPHELVDAPRFFVGGASRFDVNQGELGNCWFLAAVANLTMNEALFYQVVPKDNSFVDNYCGIFHFRFWQYGRWVDVVVDDRLPCSARGGHLIYMHSQEKNEFWSALLEKAYAKLYGSYEALSGGQASEALQDFSGGIVEVIDLKKVKQDICAVMEKAQTKQSFMGCSLKPQPNVREARTASGLVRGHAYSVTGVHKVEVSTPRKTGKIPLVRIRNPWGNDFEWKGPWSDGSKEWTLVPKKVQDELGISFGADGEFWMSFKDFVDNFDTLEIVNLGPDDLETDVKVEGVKWNTSYFEGAWIPGCTAGGCTNHISLKEPKTYACNPQYIVEFNEPGPDGDPNKCTVLIALMQKNRRTKRKEGIGSLSIGFTIYELKPTEKIPNPLDLKYFMYHRKTGDSGSYANLREVSGRFELTPGKYCIIPSTFGPNEEGEFIIRVFSEATNTMKENGGDIGLANVDEKVTEATKAEDNATKNAVQALFKQVAGEDMEIGWAKLKRVLDEYLKKEFDFDGLSREVCRSMVAMVDTDRTGKLGLDEFTELWTSILRWKGVFKLYDEDNSGSLDSFELRKALNSAGCMVNNRVLEAMVLRYGDDERNISFEDFIMCSVKLKAMIGAFKQKDPKGRNEANFTLAEWVEKTLYA